MLRKRNFNPMLNLRPHRSHFLNHKAQSNPVQKAREFLMKSIINTDQYKIIERVSVKLHKLRKLTARCSQKDLGKVSLFIYL